MLDLGLFASVAVTALVVVVGSRLLPAGDVGERSVADQFTAPLLAGIAAGRVVTLVLSDPAGLTNLREFLTVRGGVEFWPAGGAAIVVLTVLFSRPTDPPQVERVARLAPYAIVALGTFQATCVMREGCPGPRSSVGLVPHGLSTRQLPVGLMAGLLLVTFAVWLRRSALPPQTKILVAVVAIGIERSLIGLVEPSLTSTQARDGLFMVVAFSCALGWWTWYERQERQWVAPPRRSPG